MHAIYEKKRLRIAIQKNGRLHQDSMKILRACGLNIVEHERQLLCRTKELAIDILLVRDDDISGFVDQGICDLGIIGQNQTSEEQLDYEIIHGQSMNIKTVMKLGISKCRLAIAVPKNFSYSSINDLKAKRIACSYPAILNDFLKKRNLAADVIKMAGSVEVAPQLGIADAICDIISSGATLEANSLLEKDLIMASEALLISCKTLSSPEKQDISERLQRRIQGVLLAKESKYVMLNTHKDNIDKIINLLPGADSPTIIPLAKNNKVAVHSVCSEPVFWENMERLKEEGATDILVLPIEKILN